MKKYFTLWWFFTTYTTQNALASRFGVIIFLIGKLLRFFFFFFFLLLLVTKTENMAGYSLWQVVFFYATFNLIDTLPQFFFREVYRFRSYIVAGTFDHILMKPFSPLFRALFGGSDVLDVVILLLSIGFLFYAASHLDSITIVSIISYLVLVLNAFIIAMSFHIIVLSLGILTTEVDNTILLYRDLTQMGRFPIDIYKEPLRGILTFIIPVGIMTTFPAKVIMGLLSMNGIIFSLCIGAVLFYLSLSFWRYALKQYGSASS